MNLPREGDYIDIHTHESTSRIDGVLSVDSIMAHEEKSPGYIPGFLHTIGIHPWYLNESNHDLLVSKVLKTADNPSVIAVGEAGFDKIRGPSAELQRQTFEEQVYIAEEHRKPVVIHCVRSWDELFKAHKKLRPEMPWLVHGFRGKTELAQQILSKGMYLSFWFEFVMRPESSGLIRSLPAERIFLETDGSGTDIMDIYNKVSADLGVTVDELKTIIYRNFNELFTLKR